MRAPYRLSPVLSIVNLSENTAARSESQEQTAESSEQPTGRSRRAVAPAPGCCADLLGWSRSAHTADGALMITSWLRFVLVPAPLQCPPPEISGSECERVAGYLAHAAGCSWSRSALIAVSCDTTTRPALAASCCSHDQPLCRQPRCSSLTCSTLQPTLHPGCCCSSYGADHWKSCRSR